MFLCRCGSERRLACHPVTTRNAGDSAPWPGGDRAALPLPVVDVVLPCLDEAAALPWVLARLPTGYRGVVVDNGSTDDSVAVARALGATVVSESRRGYGAAVHAGLLASSAPYVAVLDCDGSVDPVELPVLVDLVTSQRADLVCGRRRAVERGAWPWRARVANWLLATTVTARGGARLHDLAPVRVASRPALLELGVVDRRCGYPLETVLRARRAGWRIAEVDIPYRPRTAGTHSKITGTVRGSVFVARDVVTVLRRLRGQGPVPFAPPQPVRDAS